MLFKLAPERGLRSVVYAVAPPTDNSMQDQGNGRSYYRDDEIVVDRDGLPHYTGENPDLIKEYKR